jgi:xanthine dehydrogenase YagS FAD-binding subunit
MRHAFDLHRARSHEEAASLLAAEGAMPLGGGTDLLVLIEENLARPTSLVDLRSVTEFRRIEATPDGDLRIGAGTRVDDLARHALVRSQYPALAEACAAVGTPALRQMGTIGGNLCQRPRCWYFRRGIACYKNGGSECPAISGENQYLSILDGGPCYAIHPSDPAVALMALEAVIEVTGSQPSELRSVPIESFFVLPTQRLDAETILRPGEFVSAIVLSADAAAPSMRSQHYYKAMQRGTWDFALVSLAAVKRMDGAVRLVFGGVAPRPWRAPSDVEAGVASGSLDAEMIAKRAFRDAQPLSGNTYKVDIATALLHRAVRELTA